MKPVWDPNSVRHVHPAVWPQWPFDSPPEVRERSEPAYNIFSEYDLMISMRDDVRLAADVHRPRAAGQKFPALISVSPYTRGLQLTEVPIGQNEAGITEFWVARGYAHVIVDCRGSNDSEGSYDDKAEKEQADYVDLIEWCAAQPWCNGSVGMIGCSYFALAQLLAAVHQPEALKAIFPYDAYTDMYRHRSTHGSVPHMGFASTWFSAVAALNLTSGRLRDPSGLRNMFDEGLSFSHPYDGEHYWRRSPSPHLDKVNIPVYFGCDWSFWWLHLAGVFTGWEEVGDVPKRILVGPQPEPRRPFGAYHEETLRWYDHWLKGMDTGVMDGPPIQLYLRGDGHWRGEEEWPLKRTEWTRIFLGGPAGGGPSGGGEGTLSFSAGGGGERTYSPDVFGKDWRLGGPKLVYRSEPVDKPLEITGPLSLRLVARSTAEDVDWFIAFMDEAPDGSARMLTRGWLRASHREVDESRSKPGRPRHPHKRSVPLTPGEEAVFEIELVPTCNVFQPGHRLRLEIASSGSVIERPGYHEALPVKADNTILEGAEGSYLFAPVIPSA
jgi:hypothetical protein